MIDLYIYIYIYTERERERERERDRERERQRQRQKGKGKKEGKGDQVMFLASANFESPRNSKFVIHESNFLFFPKHYTYNLIHTPSSSQKNV